MTDVVDLLAAEGEGPLWGTATEDLNATLLAWPGDHEVAEHVNAERDVLIVVIDGAAVVTVDGDRHTLEAGHALLIEKGSARAIRAGDGGVRYLSVHRRRGPLQVKGAPGKRG